MQLAKIKKLVRQHDADTLAAAEEAIVNGKTPDVTVPGNDEGEQLTHAYAAKWIRQKMDADELPLPQAIRAFTQKVRKSID